MGYIRVQQPLGALSQMWAALTHRMSSSRLRSIALGVPRIVLLTGDDDNLVNPSNSRRLAAAMPGAELIVWPDTGHALQLQRVDEFNALLERVVAEGRSRADAEERSNQ